MKANIMRVLLVISHAVGTSLVLLTSNIIATKVAFHASWEKDYNIPIAGMFGVAGLFFLLGGIAWGNKRHPKVTTISSIIFGAVGIVFVIMTWGVSLVRSFSPTDGLVMQAAIVRSHAVGEYPYIYESLVDEFRLANMLSVAITVPLLFCLVGIGFRQVKRRNQQ